MIEIRWNSISKAKRSVKTPHLVFLTTISSFRDVNDCNAFIIDRIGQPMCLNASFPRSEYGMCIYTNARCEDFTIRVLMREWLKFVQIGWVMRKEGLKRHLSTFWLQYHNFELWIIVTRSLSIELGYNVLNRFLSSFWIPH